MYLIDGEDSCVFSSVCSIGKDRRGWIYQGQLKYAMQDLIKIIENNRGPEYEPQAVNNTLWGIWNITT